MISPADSNIKILSNKLNFIVVFTSYTTVRTKRIENISTTHKKYIVLITNSN